MTKQELKVQIESVISKVRASFTNTDIFNSEQDFEQAIWVAAAEKAGFKAQMQRGGDYAIFTKNNFAEFQQLRIEGERPILSDYSVMLSDIIS